MFLLAIKIICKNVTNKLNKYKYKQQRFTIVSLKKYKDDLNNIKLNYKLKTNKFNFHKLYNERNI